MAEHVSSDETAYCPVCGPSGAWRPWTCVWCGEPIVPPQRWLLRSNPHAAATAYHHDCYLFGVIPAEQQALKRRHGETMAAAPEIR